MRGMAAKILLQGSIIRATYGILALLFPKLLLAATKMTEEQIGPEARYFNRLFGGRDLLVAGATVLAVRAGAPEQAVKANLLAEATDTVSLAEEARSRGGIDRTLAIGLAFNVLGYATWLRALKALKR
jgi:hypothetical protein